MATTAAGVGAVAGRSDVGAGFRLFLGPDRARKLERLNTIIQSIPVHLFDRHHLDSTACSPTALRMFLREYPAASPLRLLVIDEAQRLDDACIAILIEQAPQCPATTCLILLIEETLPERHPLTPLKTCATIETFEWLADSEVRRWIGRYLAASQKQIAQEAVQELRQRYGADLTALQAILDQLISWVGERPGITGEDLRAFLPRQDLGGAMRFSEGQPRQPKNAFVLVNAIARRDVGAALQAVHEQFAEGKDALELLGLVIWQLQRWLTVRSLIDAGVSPERIESITGIRVWQVERLVREVTGRSPQGLRRALQQCWELDVAVKSGRTPRPKEALEGLLIALCHSTPSEVPWRAVA